LDAIRRQLDQMMDQVGSGDAQTQQALRNRIAQWEAWDRDQLVDAERYGYVADAAAVGNSRERSALEELVRWRLWDRTGGGLMAELGSHQLDAASLFVSALAPEGHHARPLSVHAVGGRHIFPPDRQSEDHVYCMFEYPGPGYAPDFPVGYEDAINRYPDPERGVAAYDVDPNKRIVVTYSSINGNGFGGYGEVVMGTRGSLVLEREQEVMLFPSGNTQVKVGVTGNAQRAVLDTTATGDPGPARSAESAGPISRGYREEIEHWSWCIAQGDWDNQPRCNGPVALGDATVALVARLAIKNSQRPGGHGFVAFRPEWFDVDDDAVPESELIPDGGPTIQSERRALGLV
jgi:predicted dehydrogenase